MNTMFKVIWSTSKQCYVVASKLGTKTNDKKKLLVAAVLTALAIGGPLQVGAETTVTADKINAIDIEASNIKLENSGSEAKIYGSEISIVADDISGIPWKTVLNAGVVGVETSEVNTLIGRHGVYVSGVDDTRETIIEPKGMTIANKAGDVLEFNFDKISAGNMKIQDVAEATDDTDAVNYKQLKSYVAQRGNSRIPTLSQQGVNTNVLIGANPDGSTNYTVSVNPELVNLTSAEFGLNTDPKRSIVNTEKSQFFDGDVNTAVRANGVKLENTNNLDVAEYTMDGMMADSNGKHVRFGTQGIDAGDQVIAGVKAGVADSDVVTVKQLKDSISNVSGNVKISTLTIDANGKVAGESGVAKADNVADVINQVVERNTSDTKELKQAINSVSAETQRVGAHAAAMAALKPIQYDPLEPTQVMAGVGNYRGETAAALGLAHYTNENTMLNVGVSLGSHNMVNAGVTHKFGYSPEKKNIPDRYKGGPISSIYVMQDEMTRMQAKNDAQQVELEQQRTEIESLKSMVQQLLEKH